ncbi:MAG TPA: prolyl oligopeptidase family serine peptidase, partial [Fimbriimonas sp.]|nr:prolyl oligopeptidase family serine peptidase [Fimbriimonas sp.]
HTWPGQPAEGGSRWPSEPYKIVWQVRANGTHRIFPFYNPQWVRRTIQAMPLGTTSGYTIEGIDAYFPKSPDYYLANPKDKYCNWIHQRDEMYWMTWGRLGYDPSTKDAVFDHRAAELLCTDSQRLIEATPLIEAWKKVSTLLSKNFMAYSLGPDHRNHAPELEWGGDTDAFIQGQGFDTHVFEPVNEEFANLVTDGIDGRFSLRDAAEGIWQETSGARALKVLSRIQGPESRPRLSILQLLGQRPGNSPRASDLDKAENVQIYWAMYMASRFLSAHELANIETIFGQEYRDEEIANDDAATFFTDVTQNGFYKPFTDRLRMHTNSFSWASQQRSLDEESQRLKLLPAKDAQSVLKNALYSPFSHRQRIHGNDYYSKFDIAANVLAKPTWADSALRDDYWDHTRKPVVTCQEDNQTVSCKVRGDYLDKAWLLVKPLPSSTYFHKLPMTKVEGGFELTIPRERCGMALAVEVVSGKDAAGRPNASRWPDAMLDRPYLVVPAQSGPTPEIYNASEAMTYFDPKVIKPENYGGLLLGTRAWAFFGSYDRATKRKLLEPVEKGMRLVILQQNFERYKLDWLPKPLAFESAQSNTFDPGGELGLEKVEAPGAIWQRFLPSDGWKVFGNGGLAMTRIGKGEVWVTSARLMQNMQYQSAAKAFVKLLSLGGKSKPTILVDSCSEDATYSSSCHADLMNSHDIPFMTMGEVVAKEQGMNSEKPIAGPKMDDDVLDGKGKELADKFLKNRVIALSHRATPPSLTAFEKERVRRKRELLKALGLDPMPKKTPLNARQTGVIQGNGFHIEKVVFESRPKFYVTAHVYVPDHKTVAKLPAIVNVNGHWAHKKDEDRVQLRCQFQALRGYIAIAIDTPGFSFEGNSLIERRAEGDHNDYKLVEGGSNTTGYYVWDAMRAVDYLQTRGDVDMNHIGLTGASGGGLATLYAFAADDRYKAAVPVVYMSSLELAPDNGCLCNHVPGTCQVGDRSDVIAIQAPKPVLLMGAENDGEFPPDAMRLTHKKMAESWDLFGKKNDVYVKIFAGGHDYNQPMRETMIGFFDKYLRGVGDGSPVPQPHLEALDPENHSILVLDPPLKERTMRDLSKEYLAAAPSKVPVAKVFEVNGGVPERTPLNYKETGEGSKKQVVFESEPGLFTPGILVLPSGTPRGVRIVASDAGKKAEAVAGDDGFATLYLDVLGTGELSGIEMRYAVYAGRAVSFTAGWQIVRAAEAMRRYSDHIEVFGEGPMCSQAAMYAGLMDNHFAHVTGTDCLKTWTDVFADNIPDIAVQPRAHLCGSLEELRSLVKNGEWRYR